MQTNGVLPFARLRDLQEYDPQPDRKCIACNGEGELPVIDVHGMQRGIARCPICGGTKYEP